MPKKTDSVLPDLLQSDLRLVFCGTAPGTVSAQRGQYYAHPQNKFWRTLHATGLMREQRRSPAPTLGQHQEIVDSASAAFAGASETIKA